MTEFQREYRKARRKGYDKSKAAIIAGWFSEGSPDF